MKKYVSLMAVCLLAAFFTNGALRAKDGDHDRGDQVNTRTPIKHVLVIIGENRTFDSVFGAYRPSKGQTIENLLSEGIINPDGTPGPNVAQALQNQASDTGTFSISPTITGPYSTLPPPNTDGAPTKPPFASVQAAMAVEPGLLPAAYNFLTIGGTGLASDVVDSRFPASLINAPYQITDSVSYDDYTGSPVHRFYQMWQQLDCNIKYATTQNPSGCREDLFPWVEVSVGAGSNGKSQPAGFNDESTGEGSISMGFYNVNSGDAPYLTQLARTYALSDNYHQAINGGTGANHVALGTGAEIYYSDVNGNAAVPPTNEIENPNPMSGTNNWYAQDGYSGGSYTNCSDMAQPGVAPIMNYLNSLSYAPFQNGDCAPNAYYLLNNYNPGYNADGTVNTAPFTIPPSTVPTIADQLTSQGISWRYYGEGWNNANPNSVYCTICNPFQYSTAVMTSASGRAHIQDVTQLYTDLANGWLPSVAYIKPDGYLDGHPASSKLELFEGFVQKIVDQVKANPDLWKSTAIFITFDEGGGYYDSGYVQPIDFFGDGTRIPLIVVSPYSEGGRVVHTYADHVSVLKFIEANWRLHPVSDRSRDNLPNPVASPFNPYVPVNGPAIGNLMSMFNFHSQNNDPDHGN